jgi:hypothetical protein
MVKRMHLKKDFVSYLVKLSYLVKQTARQTLRERQSDWGNDSH